MTHPHSFLLVKSSLMAIVVVKGSQVSDTHLTAAPKMHTGTCMGLKRYDARRYDLTTIRHQRRRLVSSRRDKEARRSLGRVLKVGE